MKKALLCIFVALVSWALVGTPVEAAQSAKPGMTLVKKHKKHHKKKHKKHKA